MSTVQTPHPDSGRALVALNRVYGQRHIYAGTVPVPVVAERRRRNKQAAASRRVNRRTR